MVTRSQDCPREDKQIRGGNGLIHLKHLSGEEGLYHHARMFAHLTVEPGRSIGFHEHEHETEFFYILSGEGLFDDDGVSVTVHAGDVCDGSCGGCMRDGLRCVPQSAKCFRFPAGADCTDYAGMSAVRTGSALIMPE